jgi:hypothetical protein
MNPFESEHARCIINEDMKIEEEMRNVTFKKD